MLLCPFQAHHRVFAEYGAEGQDKDMLKELVRKFVREMLEADMDRTRERPDFRLLTP